MDGKNILLGAVLKSYFEGYLFLEMATPETATPETATKMNEVKENVLIDEKYVKREPERSLSPVALQHQNENDQNGASDPTGNLKPGDRVKIGVDEGILQLIESSMRRWKPGMAEVIPVLHVTVQ